LINIYEDNTLRRLPEKRFESLPKTYGDEQGTLENVTIETSRRLKKYEDDSRCAERFMKLVERYTDFEEITPFLIHEFVVKTVVYIKENQYVHSSP